ncbi:MAG: alpha/beta hydrolase [Deltaproteobacteria bacterium]|nr:alpha/beta hydrolase [Deltaproteobacteria bacterium]
MASGMLKEERVKFPGPAGLLEGLLGNESAIQNGVVVALHPHPQFGGSMNNNVVETIVRAGQGCGLATLRFNFRGVGLSEGESSGGMGEQDDIRAALDFLEQGFNVGPKVVAGLPARGEPCRTAVTLAGYSFGAVVALAYCHRQGHRADHLLLISPPPSLMPEGVSLETSVLRKIIVGEEDELAPPEEIKTRVSASRQEELIEFIPGANHFFGGREDDLEKRLVKLL